MSKENILYYDEAAVSGELKKMLETLSSEYPLRSGKSKGIKLVFEKNTDKDTLSISLEDGKALISYGTLSQAARAVGTLLSGVLKKDEKLEERLDFSTLGIMLDCSRNAVMTVEHFKKWLRRLALFGYNMAMLYTEDTYELQGEEFFGYLRGSYTAEELKSIDEYASNLGIEMIPCIQTLGHLAQILKWPAFKDVKDTESVLYAGKKETYELIEKMISHWSTCFKSRRVHIGMDEAHDMGRGKYMDNSGYKRGFDIFNDHLAELMKICGKYGVKPMIWSDMYFRMGSKTGAYYDKECRIPEDVKNSIPKKAELVYWDYYHDNKEFYNEWIKRHRDLGFEPLMASGIWTWKQFWYNSDLTEKNAGPCIEACREEGIKELIFTLWGDDGAYCDFDSSLAGIAYSAEKSYSADVSEKVLEKKFSAICGSDYKAHRLAGNIHNPSLLPVPALWDDPLLGIYMNNRRAHNDVSLSKIADYYYSLSESLEKYSDENAAGNFRHIMILSKTLAVKTEIADWLYKAYAGKDKKSLKAVREHIPDMLEMLEKLSKSFRGIWMARNKPFGFEVLQIRLAGLSARYRELERRLDDLLKKHIDSIPELDANLNPPKGDVPAGNYKSHATASSIL